MRTTLPSLLFLLCTATLLHSAPRNVVVILADDHALKVTGAYGNDIIRTPNLDRLSREGITFEQAYCNAPICSASRQSLLTGKYPHATGVNLLFTPFPDEGNFTIAEHLRERDYRTAVIGKTHWNNWAWGPLYENGAPDHGFDLRLEKGAYNQWLKTIDTPTLPDNVATFTRQGLDPQMDTAEFMNWHARPHPTLDATSEGTFYARAAIDFIKASGAQPFFLWLAFKEPHQPFYFPIEFADRYDPADMPLPEGSPEDDRWIPAKYRNLSEAERRGIIAAYYTSTEYMDKNIGLVLDALDTLGLSEDTLVLYLSDNGYLLNQHKRFEKHTMWEEAIRQPMIVRSPGSVALANTRNDALIEYIDVVPTILELIGQDALHEAQGDSFAPILQGEATQHKSLALSTYLQDNLAMVTDGTWKYVFHTGSRDLGISYATGYGPAGLTHRLYNLEKDPNEHHDVSREPEHSVILLRLQEAMLQRFIDTHPDAHRLPAGLTLEGKLVWFCEPRDIGDDQMANDVPTRVFAAPQGEFK